MRHGTPVRAPTADGASRRLFALIGAALLVGAAAAATGCSAPPPTSLLATSPTATAIAGAEAAAETPVPETTDQPAPAAPPAPTAVPVEIGSKRQLFVDDWLVDVATSTTLVPAPSTRGRGRPAARRTLGRYNRRLFHRVQGRRSVPDVLQVPQRRERDDLLRGEH